MTVRGERIDEEYMTALIQNITTMLQRMLNVRLYTGNPRCCDCMILCINNSTMWFIL